jgi:CRP-like cAMP-binding protein
MTTRTFQNSILQAFSPEIVERLHLQPVTFELYHEFEYPGRTIDYLYFVEDGMASQTTTFRDGSQVEVGMFGFESVIGVSALMGTRRSLNRIYTQIAGSGYAVPVALARREFVLGGNFQYRCLCYVQVQLLQAMQSAGCNAKHEIDQRLCRWLLLCADRAHATTFRMPHELLADMLGSTRPTVTHAAIGLKDAGLIRYSRGVIHLLDLEGLQARACECYGVVERHLGNQEEFAPRPTA